MREPTEAQRPASTGRRGGSDHPVGVTCTGASAATMAPRGTAEVALSHGRAHPWEGSRPATAVIEGPGPPGCDGATMTSWIDPGWALHYVDVDGRRTVVRASTIDAGAVPIVHVHGFGISGAYLMPTARLLTGRARNVVPDLPGYGRSQKPARPPAHPAPRRCARGRSLDALEIDRAVLVRELHGVPDQPRDGGTAPGPGRPASSSSRLGAGSRTSLGRDGPSCSSRSTAVRESPRMARIAVPDYVRFGPINSLRLFARHDTVPLARTTLEDPVPDAGRPREPLGSCLADSASSDVARQVPGHVTVVADRSVPRTQ